MTKAEIEAALQAAFSECDATGCPLSEQQKRILLQVAEALTEDLLEGSPPVTETVNPLEGLTLTSDKHSCYLLPVLIGPMTLGKLAC